MQGNDLANSVPKTLLVNIDCILDAERAKHRILGIVPKETVTKSLNMLMVNRIYRIGFGIDATLEAVSTDGSDLSVWEHQLDRLNVNPFRAFTTYGSVSELVNQLPFRPGLAGVVDIASRGLMYGSFFVPITRIT